MLGLGTFTVIAIYLALNALYLYAMPVAELANVPGGRLIDTVAERLFGFVAANLVAGFTIVSIAASVSAMVIAGPRVYFAMARDGLFPDAAQRISARTRVPAVAIVAQSVWSAWSRTSCGGIREPRPQASRSSPPECRCMRG